jgi:hypothetical protein
VGIFGSQMVKPGFKDSPIGVKVKGLSKTTFKVWINSLVGHSEGATRSGLLAEKKIFANMLIATPATEESLVASRHEQKILRRPMVVCQITICGTGLLRMTEKSIFGVNI